MCYYTLTYHSPYTPKLYVLYTGLTKPGLTLYPRVHKN